MAMQDDILSVFSRLGGLASGVGEAGDRATRSGQQGLKLYEDIMYGRPVAGLSERDRRRVMRDFGMLGSRPDMRLEEEILQNPDIGRNIMDIVSRYTDSMPELTAGAGPDIGTRDDLIVDNTRAAEQSMPVPAGRSDSMLMPELTAGEYPRPPYIIDGAFQEALDREFQPATISTSAIKKQQRLNSPENYANARPLPLDEQVSELGRGVVKGIEQSDIAERLAKRFPQGAELVRSATKRLPEYVKSYFKEEQGPDLNNRDRLRYAAEQGLSADLAEAARQASDANVQVTDDMLEQRTFEDILRSVTDQPERPQRRAARIRESAQDRFVNSLMMKVNTGQLSLEDAMSMIQRMYPDALRDLQRSGMMAPIEQPYAPPALPRVRAKSGGSMQDKISNLYGNLYDKK